MTTPRDPDEILAAWLDEGPTRLPDATRRAIVVALPTTSRRRHAWSGPWRFPIMTMTSKLAIGAVAVIAILVGGAFLLRPGGSDGGIGGAPVATPTPTPSPTAAPTQTPTPSPTPVASPTPGALSVGEGPAPLAAGTYPVSDPFPVPLSVTVPDGWSGNIGGPYALFLVRTTGRGAVDVTIFDDVFADPCDSSKGFLAPRPLGSADALVAALANMPNVKPTKPVNSTIAGLTAKQLTLTAPSSATCSPGANGQYPTWELPLGAVQGIGPGQSDRVWVVDVGGYRLVIDALEPVVRDAALHAEIQSILDSLKIQPTGS